MHSARGIGFYGSPPGNHSVGGKDFVVDLSDTATLDLITFAAKLSKELYPDAPELPRHQLINAGSDSLI